MSAATQADPSPIPVYLALGSNINPERYLPLALKYLEEQLEVVEVSSAWQTPAVGFRGEDFLNAVVLIKTRLSCTALKYRILRPMEAQLGRVRTENKFSPRTIDIDILIYGGQLIEEEMWEQPHLAIPLAELNPGYTQDGGRRSVGEVAGELRGASEIIQRGDVLG